MSRLCYNRYFRGAIPVNSKGAKVIKVSPIGFLRLYWQDAGMALAIACAVFLLTKAPGGVSLFLWLNLIALFLHQFEEYRFPGRFPQMFNRVMFSSSDPDVYPLNRNSSHAVNLGAWLVYFLAALLGHKFLWLGIAAIMASLGNVLAHALIFNIRGRTFYNPGMATSVAFFLPVSALFLRNTLGNDIVSAGDWAGGLALGIFLGAGIFGIIGFMKDKGSGFSFGKK